MLLLSQRHACPQFVQSHPVLIYLKKSYFNLVLVFISYPLVKNGGPSFPSYSALQLKPFCQVSFQSTLPHKIPRGMVSLRQNWYSHLKFIFLFCPVAENTLNYDQKK